MIRKVLVSGGAGYIGSHTAHQLVAADYETVVLDNFYSGYRWAVPDESILYEGDIADQALLARIFNEQEIDAVIHFAGHIIVPESVIDPLKYYANNVAGSIALLRACHNAGVRYFVFSSSAAVYGIPDTIPIHEDYRANPINPYGCSKLVTEWNLRDLAAADKSFHYAALRYFNVAGARADGLLGQATSQATHLIKVACQAICGLRSNLSIYGTDYDTPDGTCIRDYIHVEDLARAHLDALEYLCEEQISVTLNCGYGLGYSVKEVIDCVQRVSGVSLNVVEAPRRNGDPPVLVADNQRIKSTLGWEPCYNDLDLICRTAIEWERQGSIPKAAA